MEVLKIVVTVQGFGIIALAMMAIADARIKRQLGNRITELEKRVK